MPPVQLYVGVGESVIFGALLGMAFALILMSSRIFNFALGAYAAVAALVSVELQDSLGVAGAAIAGIGAAALLSLASEALVFRPIHARYTQDLELKVVIGFVALLFALSQGSGWLFGQEFRRARPLIAGDPVRFLDMIITPHALVAAVLTALTFVGVAAWLRRSRSGKMFRAVGDSEYAARQVGIPVERMRMVGFALAGSVAGLAGVLHAPKAGVSFSSALGWTLTGFLVLVIGGTGRVAAPVVGGLVLALINVLGPYYFGGEYADYLILLCAAVVFMFMPEGLFRTRVRA